MKTKGEIFRRKDVSIYLDDDNFIFIYHKNRSIITLKGTQLSRLSKHLVFVDKLLYDYPTLIPISKSKLSCYDILLKEFINVSDKKK